MEGTGVTLLSETVGAAGIRVNLREAKTELSLISLPHLLVGAAPKRSRGL
jgi:hypothetical protein